MRKTWIHVLIGFVIIKKGSTDIHNSIMEENWGVLDIEANFKGVNESNVPTRDEVSRVSADLDII